MNASDKCWTWGEIIWFCPSEYDTVPMKKALVSIRKLTKSS